MGRFFLFLLHKTQTKKTNSRQSPGPPVSWPIQQWSLATAKILIFLMKNLTCWDVHAGNMYISFEKLNMCIRGDQKCQYFYRKNLTVWDVDVRNIIISYQKSDMFICGEQKCKYILRETAYFEMWTSEMQILHRRNFTFSYWALILALAGWTRALGALRFFLFFTYVFVLTD